MNIKRLFLMSMLAVATAFVASASPDGWDEDDDIYYNPSKKSTKKENPNYVPNTVVDYPGADTYAPSTSGLNVDVDTYNRNGSFLVADSVSASAGQSRTADSFAYTRRIEQFHDGDIVNASGDQELVDYYYSSQPQEINIYITDPYYSFRPYYRSYYNPWYWDSYYWDPFYWNIGWGFHNPWYNWTWGWSWTWGPSWYPGPMPPMHGPGWGHHPVPGGRDWAINPAGATRPHRPASASSTVRRPGEFSAGASNMANRPGNSSNKRPAAVSPSAGSSSDNSSSTFTRRGRNNSSSSSSVNQNNNRRNDDNSSYSGSRRNSSSSSFGSGSRGSGGRSSGSSGTRSSSGGGRGRR